VGPKEDRITVNTLLDAVVRDYENRGNRSVKNLRFPLAHLRADMGDMRAVQVTTPVVERFKAARLADGAAKATIDRSLAALRRAYSLAVKHGIIAPGRVPAIELFNVDNVRQDLICHEEYLALLKLLPEPIDDMLTFGYWSGWRKGEILGLTWAEVDRTRGLITLPGERSKNGEPRELPLSPELARLIEKRWRARLVDGPTGPRISEHVFHRAGQRVRDFRGAWRKATKAIGRPGLRFHGLRRSAITNLMRAGVGEQVAMKISGHKTTSVFRRYRIISTDDVLVALRQTEASLKADPHKMAVHPHNGHAAAQNVAPVREG
jgi:integrase